MVSAVYAIARERGKPTSVPFFFFSILCCTRLGARSPLLVVTSGSVWRVRTPNFGRLSWQRLRLFFPFFPKLRRWQEHGFANLPTFSFELLRERAPALDADIVFLALNFLPQAMPSFPANITSDHRLPQLAAVPNGERFIEHSSAALYATVHLGSVATRRRQNKTATAATPSGLCALNGWESNTVIDSELRRPQAALARESRRL